MKLTALSETLIALKVSEDMKNHLEKCKSPEHAKRIVQDAVYRTIEVIREKYKGDI